MLDSILNSTIANTSISVGVVLTSIAVAFMLGLLISFTYLKTNDEQHSENFVIALIFLPVVMSTVILLIGNNVAGAFSLAGVFSVIRFRSAPGSTKDIIYILLCIGAGLSCGIQAYQYGFIFTIIVSLALFVLNAIKFGKHNDSKLKLTILVPEDLNQEDIFDEILTKYTKDFTLKRMKTKDLGSVFELMYIVVMEKNINKKELMDELRCRNGNLNIALSVGEMSDEF